MKQPQSRHTAGSRTTKQPEDPEALVKSKSPNTFRPSTARASALPEKPQKPVRQLPKSTTNLTNRDRDILEALTHAVRVFSLQQITRTWWPLASAAAASARMRALTESELLQIQVAPAHPELELHSPLTQWSPGDGAPDSGALSYRLQSRWTLPLQRTLCISATQLAASMFTGHGGRFPREVERTHDIHLAAVYLLYRLRSPALLSGWTHEEELRRELPRKGERLPDVILQTDAGPRAIEFGGSYPKRKLEAFHLYCVERSLPYEVW
jgi:hypothetical protein